MNTGHITTANQPQLSRLADPATLEVRCYDELRRAVTSGVLRPGQQLSADRLSRELGVSRMPVVHALRRLAVEGFVDAVPHKPVTVVQPSEAQIRERYLFMQALEHTCVREAFQIDPEQLAAELRQVHATEDQTGKDSAAKSADIDLKFHSVIWDMSGLPQVAGTLRMLWDRGGYLRVLLFTHTELHAQRLAEHREIVGAALRHDYESLQSAVEVHRVNGMARIIAIAAESAR